MKKFTKIMSLVLAIMMVAVLFVGCGGGEGGNSIVGKWEIKEEAEGMEVSMVFNFKSNGDFEMTSEMNGSALVSEEGTYKVEGDKITMNIDGEESTSSFSIDGNKLTISEDGSEIVLTRK